MINKEEGYSEFLLEQTKLENSYFLCPDMGIAAGVLGR